MAVDINSLLSFFIMFSNGMVFFPLKEAFFQEDWLLLGFLSFLTVFSLLSHSMEGFLVNSSNRGLKNVYEFFNDFDKLFCLFVLLRLVVKTRQFILAYFVVLLGLL